MARMRRPPALRVAEQEPVQKPVSMLAGSRQEVIPATVLWSPGRAQGKRQHRRAQAGIDCRKPRDLADSTLTSLFSEPASSASLLHPLHQSIVWKVTAAPNLRRSWVVATSTAGIDRLASWASFNDFIVHAAKAGYAARCLPGRRQTLPDFSEHRRESSRQESISIHLSRHRPEQKSARSSENRRFQPRTPFPRRSGAHQR